VVSRKAVLFLIIASAFLLATIPACSREESSLINSIIRLSPARYEDELPSDEKIAEWKRDVERFEAVVEEKINAADRAASLHKLLAEEYSKLEMYGLALEEYEEVLQYEPSNFVVLYSAGVSASQYGLSRPNPGEIREYLERAARYHQRAIEINPGYREPYLALGILYYHELDRIEDAKDLLSRGVELFPNENSRMLFVLAQIAVTENRLEDAIDIYDRIANSSRNAEEKNAAIANREELLGSQ
jgi:tetratricopeptide (TPR) repeat protein